MNKIQDSFLIQDLEILSGVKAHTIRIWEKRYNLLNPIRLNRNIRKYSLEDLQKLLNVSVLYNDGLKISKLSKLSDIELCEEARKISLSSISSNFHVNSLIVSMYSFDTLSFNNSYSELIDKMSFEKVFVDVYIPLLNHIGVLWQTDAIKPAHEHFISNLIVEKIVLHSAKIEAVASEDDKTYILFLPEGELHSLGLLFLNYCLKIRGKKTLYIGGAPLSSLEMLNEKFTDIVWICPFVIDKTLEEKDLFINNLSAFLEKTGGNSMIIGRIWENYTNKNSNKSVNLYSNFSELPFF
jgi:DNA-binding transcriptional MerR regulator